MKLRVYISILFACAIGVCIWLSLWRPGSPLPEPPAVAQSNQLASIRGSDQGLIQSNVPPKDLHSVHQSSGLPARIDAMKHEMVKTAQLWHTPLLYYGKVVDESNRPIAGVQVSYSGNALDESLTKEVRNQGTVVTDQRGIFKIDGLYGIGLMFQLSHPDYYAYPDNSTGFDVRSPPRDGVVENSEANARTFCMHSKGHPVPLVHRRGGVDVPVNSGDAIVDFYGQEDKQVVGTLQIEAAGDTPKNYSRTPYDWSVRLTVPGGGLVEFTNQFDFVAPDSGYQQSIEIDMSKDQPGWSDTVNKSFFAKIPSGYLRVRIHMRAKTPLYTSLEYFYNPDGSRNLEAQ